MNHSRNHAVKVLAFFEVLFKMIEELTESHSINSSYGQFVTYQIQSFLEKQEKLKKTIPAEMDYCLDLVIAEINSIFIPSTTELEVLNGIIKKISGLRKGFERNHKDKERKTRSTNGNT